MTGQYQSCHGARGGGGGEEGEKGILVRGEGGRLTAYQQNLSFFTKSAVPSRNFCRARLGFPFLKQKFHSSI